MIKSMTGFGKGQASSEELALSVEIKTVNHRFCDITIKAPRVVSPFEPQLKQRICEVIGRGKVDVFINFGGGATSAIKAVLNRPLAEAYVTVFQELLKDFPVREGIPLELLAAQKDLIQIQDAEPDERKLREVLFTAVDSALDGLNAMRCREGQATAEDLQKRLAALAGLLGRIEELAPEVPREWRLKLAQRLEKYAPEISYDPQRLDQELAVFADRCDVSEEISRFRSHLAQFELLFSSPEPVGRKMDFLVQELNREVNTIGSKSNHADLTCLVVDLKAELEKIREQVQNVE